MMYRIQPREKGVDGAGFLPEISCRPDTHFEPRQLSLPQPRPAQQSGVAKLGKGPRSILPGGVLSEDGAEDDLQAGACRPPALGTELPKKLFVVRFQHFTRLNSKRLSRALHRFEVNTALSRKSSSAPDYQIGRASC